jgi:NDP-sugar pyrophosphorylase family protein
MLTIADRPLLEITIALLREHGVHEIAVNLHHRPESIVRHFGDGASFGVTLTYSYEFQLLGTAGAAKRLVAFLDEPFFVIYGDVLTDLSLSDLGRWHHERRAIMTVALYPVEDPTRAGIVDIDSDGRVRRFKEKPRSDEVFSNLASAGILVAEPDVLDEIPFGTTSDFGQDLIPSLLSRGAPVYGRLSDAYVLDIGGLDRYEQAQADAFAGRVHLYPTDAEASSRLGTERIQTGVHRAC